MILLAKYCCSAGVAYLRLPLRVPVDLLEGATGQVGGAVRGDVPALLALSELDQLLVGLLAGRHQPVALGQRGHVGRVEEVLDELHGLLLGLGVLRHGQRLRVGRLVGGHALHRRQRDPLEVGRRLLDHLLAQRHRAGQHRVLAGEEARQGVGAAHAQRRPARPSSTCRSCRGCAAGPPSRRRRSCTSVLPPSV